MRKFLFFLPLALVIIVGWFVASRQSSPRQNIPPFVYIPNRSVDEIAQKEPSAALPEKKKREELPVPEEPAPVETTPTEPAMITEPATPAELPTPPTPPSAEPEAATQKEAMDPKEIVKKADDLMRGESIKGTYNMSIHTPSWDRTLSLYVYSLGRNKMFIRILSPSKEAGIGTLRIDNEMWNYLPDIEKTLKIPPSMMLQPWMGSDFANDDLVKESSIVNDYDHQLLSITSLNEDVAYKIEMKPKSTSAVVWGKRIQWIRMKDNVPLKEEYYDDKDELIKILTYSDIGQVSDRIIPRTWTMRSFIKPSNYTTIYLKDVEYDQPIQNNIFTLQNLKKIQ